MKGAPYWIGGPFKNAWIVEEEDLKAATALARMFGLLGIMRQAFATRAQARDFQEARDRVWSQESGR